MLTTVFLVFMLLSKREGGSEVILFLAIFDVAALLIMCITIYNIMRCPGV